MAEFPIDIRVRDTELSGAIRQVERLGVRSERAAMRMQQAWQRSARAVQRSLEGISKTTSRLAQNSQRSAATFSAGAGAGASSSGNALQFAAVTAGAAALAISASKASDAYTNLTNQIRTVTTSEQELVETRERLFKISTVSRGQIAATTKLYARLERAQKVTGVTGEKLFTVVETLNKALSISGATTQESAAALLQLSQGIQSNKLGGEELNTVFEQLPIVAELIAKKLDQPITKIRKLASEGKLTGDIVVESIAEGAEAINKQFNKTIPTIGDAFQELRNQWIKFVGELNDSTGAFSSIASVVSVLARNLDLITRVIGVLAGPLGVLAVAKAIQFLTAKLVLLTAAAKANPLLALTTALATVISLVVAFGDKVQFSFVRSFTVLDFGVGLFKELGSIAREVLGGVIFLFDQVFGGVGDGISDSIGSFEDFIRAAAGLFDRLSRTILRIFALIKETITSVTRSIKDQVTELSEFIGGDFGFGANINGLSDELQKLQKINKEIVALRQRGVSERRLDLEARVQTEGEVNTVNELRARIKLIGRDIEQIGDRGAKRQEKQLSFLQRLSQEYEKIDRVAPFTGLVDRSVERARERALARERTEQTRARKRQAQKIAQQNAEAEKRAKKFRKDTIKDLASLAGGINPILRATQELVEARKTLSDAQKLGLVSAERAAELDKLKTQSLQDELKPLAALNREIEKQNENLRAQINLAPADLEQRRIRNEVQEIANKFKSQGNDLTEAEIVQLQKSLQLQSRLTKQAAEQDKRRQAAIAAAQALRDADPVTNITQSTVDRLRDSATQGATDFAGAWINAVGSVQSAIEDFVVTGELNFRSLTQSILRQLTRLLTNQLLLQLLGGPTATGGVQGNPFALLSNTSGLLGGTILGGNGAQTGGTFFVPGQGGPDSKVVSMRLSPGERVDVTPQGQRPRMQGMESGMPAQVDVHVTNSMDPVDFFTETLRTPAGGRAINNHVRLNRKQLRRIGE